MSLVDADKVQSIIQYFATVLWTLWSFNRLFCFLMFTLCIRSHLLIT